MTHTAWPMMDDRHWLTTIAHHAHFMLRWAKNPSKFSSVASVKSSNSQQFSHINVMGLIQMHREANLTCRKRSNVKKKIFKGSYHIWAWWPSWSTYSDHFNNLSFPWLKKAQYEIWANLAQWLQRRRNLKFSTIFLFKCMGLIQMHREANLTLP